MSWALLAALALILLLPLAFALRSPAAARDRADADRALFHAQLGELDHEREAGRLTEAGHADAKLEVQRRLLAAPPPTQASTGGRAPLLAALIGIPALASGFYLLHGNPGLPSASYAARQEMGTRDEILLVQLRGRIAGMAPGETRRTGLILLGNAERNRGNFPAAAAAWREALDTTFEPGLAGDLAEVELERGQNTAALIILARAAREAPQDPRLRFLSGVAQAATGRSDTARATWTALLAEAPADAPWRATVEARLRALQ